jgi:hypothetical protein
MTLRKKRRVLLHAIFEDPLPGNVKWRDVESLFEAMGATITEGKGSRIRVYLNERRAVFHRPHPEPDTGKDNSGPSAIFWRMQESDQNERATQIQRLSRRHR